MNTLQQLTNIARNLVIGLLQTKVAEGFPGYVLTLADIRGVLDDACAIPSLKAKVTPDMIESVEAELLASFTTDGGTFDILVDDTDHVAWLTAQRKGEVKWGYWNRYAEYMMSVERKPATVVKTVDDVTERILGRIEDPIRAGTWSVRGLVVGSVQSGKTANYIGLINKAIDSGYKLIVVMAGVHEALRRQTQIRVDETVTGFDTRSGPGKPQVATFGVGIGSTLDRKVNILTSASHDFNRKRAEALGVQVGGDPVILVVKKNKRIMENLQNWILEVGGKLKPGQPEGGERWIPGCPALIIDDEADNASINTSKEGRSSINKAMVGLLTSLEKAAYVGYTATPYANLFADINDEENIYPRNFIVNIKPPGNYLGVERIFGIDADGDAGIEAKEPLPIVEEIDTYADFIPPKHRMDFVPKALPPCLIKAVKVFVLGTAAKNFRLSKGVRLQKHSSMLVHVSHYKAVIDKFADLVRALKDQLRDDASVGDESVIDEFEKLWDSEFGETFPDFDVEDQGMPVTWADIRPLIKPTLDSVQVRAIHGESQVTLDYDVCKDGLIVIAVGGNKLSRGLTLESLIVSYYLRTSKLYDTLMQMGRWFGYRDGYVDLCRVYTTRQLINWYSHIALADHELRLEFDRLCESGRKPSEYGLKVRAHPDGMKITAMSRMRFATMCDITYAGKLVQTTVLTTKKTEVVENMDATRSFFASLGAGRTHTNYPNYTYYPSVSSKSVCDYISKMHIPPGANRFVKQLIVPFIEKQISYATRWNVVFAPLGMSTSEAAMGVTFDFNGKPVKAISRKVEAPKKSRPVRQLGDEFSPVKHNLLSPDDQGADLHFTKLTPELVLAYHQKKGLASYLGLLESYQVKGLSLYEAALALTREKMGPNKKGELPSVPSGEFCRLLRPEGQALLLVYPVTPLIDKEKVVSANGKHSWSSELALLDHPLIGVAISFSASDKVVPVRYAVDDVVKLQIFGPDPDQDWDDEAEDDIG
jgi:hypothetical protein